MRIEKQLVDDWNTKYPIGTDVIVKKDDRTEQRTKTRSVAYMLGASREYPGHTAVIMLDGISGCYALDRVREIDASIKRAMVEEYEKQVKKCPTCGLALTRTVTDPVYRCQKCEPLRRLAETKETT